MIVETKSGPRNWSIIWNSRTGSPSVIDWQAIKTTIDGRLPSNTSWQFNYGNVHHSMNWDHVELEGTVEVGIYVI